ncbi:inverse autotransporter beta domain-containing protein [Kiloniella antarctica]|uniref:Inverse autotransporter beta domain-containing protein n=1 Tax=Kiloniella antarctica TaxID=1550907 RepID=A0ABW5BKW3_9PROT
MPKRTSLTVGGTRTVLALFIMSSTFLSSTWVNAEENTVLEPGPSKKWGAHIEFEGKYGTDRHIGESSVFVPLYQDEKEMLFLDIRGKMDNHKSREANVGLGYRRIIDEDWLIGGYGFYDRRRSPEGNSFNQMTFGAEIMSGDFDLRMNGYVPFGDTIKTSAQHDSVQLNGSSITMKEGEERAMKGGDVEIGHTLPWLSLTEDGSDEFKLYLGGYHFWENDLDSVTGPRLRAEYRLNDVLMAGTRVSFNGEFQRDSPRGKQGFIGLKFRIPLQPDIAKKRARLSKIERRMTETIVRDIDVVAQAGSFGAEVPAIDMETGHELVNLNVIEGKSGAELKAAIEAASVGQVSFVNGQGQILNVSDTINLQSGQRVQGQFNVVHPNTGRQMSFGQTHVNGTDVNKNVFEMNDNSTLSGMTVSGGAHGIHSDGKNNVRIEKVNIRKTSQVGLNFENGTGLDVVDLEVSNLDFDNADGFSNANPNNTVTAVGVRLVSSSDIDIDNYTADYVGTGLFSNAVTDLNVRNSRISRSRKEGMVHHYLHDATFDNLSIDKTGADGAAFIVSADVNFTNSTLTNLGAMNSLGQYSGVNISGFSSDGSIIVGATENKNYNFENITITNASNSGMMLQEIKDSNFKNIDIANVNIIGVQLMRMMRDVENLTFDNVDIDNAGNAGFWMMGDFRNIDADITTTNTAVPCGKSKFMPTNLTQNGGQELIINGDVFAPADISARCADASNF